MLQPIVYLDRGASSSVCNYGKERKRQCISKFREDRIKRCERRALSVQPKFLNAGKWYEIFFGKFLENPKLLNFRNVNHSALNSGNSGEKISNGTLTEILGKKFSKVWVFIPREGVIFSRNFRKCYHWKWNGKRPKFLPRIKMKTLSWLMFVANKGWYLLAT